MKIKPMLAIGFTILSIAPDLAMAQSFDLYIGGGGPRYDDGYDRPPPPRRGDYRRGCDPDRAIDMARRYGMRRPRIDDISRRTVIVTGIGRYGEQTEMVLANEPRCRRIN